MLTLTNPVQATTAKAITIEFIPDQHPSDEWDVNAPAFKYFDRVCLMSDLPDSDPNIFLIVGMELYAPRWREGTTLMCQPFWYYGIRQLSGKGSTKWFAQEELCLASHAYLVQDDPENF